MPASSSGFDAAAVPTLAGPAMGLSSSALKQRVLAGLGANAFGQAVTVAIQLVSVPVLLSRWDAATYGTWLVLTAIPAYISMAELGMVAAAGNRMTMAMGRGDSAEANRSFHSAIVFMAAVCALIALLGLPLIAFAPLPGRDDADVRWALSFLLTGVVFSLLGGLYDALFRATGRYARGVLLSHLERIVEWLALLGAFYLAGSFSAMALAQLVVRMLGFVVITRIGLQGDPRIRWGVSAATRAELRQLFRMGLHYMTFAAGQAFSLQGFTLVVGALLNAPAVAVFNTYRTIARTLVQAIATLSHALAPEFATLFGAGRLAHLRRLYRRAGVASALAAVALALLLYAAAPWLLKTWTLGAVPFEAASMAMMLAYAAVGAVWHVPKDLLMATTRHARLGLVSVLLGAAGVAAAVVLGHLAGLPGIVLALLGAEVLMGLAAAMLARRALRETT